MQHVKGSCSVEVLREAFEFVTKHEQRWKESNQSLLDQKRTNLVLNTRSLLVKIDAKQIGKLIHGRAI